MTGLISAASPFYIFSQSDTFGRIIVLLLLAISIFAWFLMVDKWVTLSQAVRDTNNILNAFSQKKSMLKLHAEVQKYSGPIPYIYQAGTEQLCEIYQLDEAGLRKIITTERLPRHLTAFESETVRSSLERVVNSSIIELEDKMGLLATVVSTSPFFGLLGTVWGVMIAFAGMAEKGASSIGAVAPGISGALLTTVVGLIVAIPSVIGYNLLANTIKSLTVKMDNFVEEYMTSITLYKTEK